ncbi:MAG: TonB-dependent receptor [Bacteroidia bacterium]|nr:TonB-dependent receptor [Bacteroidia bacterium]
MLSYGKCINRADEDELNPFPEYTNPRNINAGNPNIKPEQIHSFEFGYSIKQKKYSLFPTLYHRYIYDGFTEISRYVNDTVFLTTFANLSSNKAAGLEFIVTGKAKEFLSLNFNAIVFYTENDAFNFGYTSNKSAHL